MRLERSLPAGQVIDECRRAHGRLGGPIRRAPFPAARILRDRPARLLNGLGTWLTVGGPSDRPHEVDGVGEFFAGIAGLDRLEADPA
jgi:hypothetical protein